jgi:hypothetical protein
MATDGATASTARVQRAPSDLAPPRSAYLVDLGAAAEEIGRLRWALRQVIALADEAPGLTGAQLRQRLLVLADRTCPGGQS